MLQLLLHMMRPGALILVTGAAILSGGGDDPRPPRAQQTVVTATDFAFEAPDTIGAGVVTLRLRNHGLGMHQMVLLRLEGRRTLRDLERELITSGRLPAWAVDVGGPGSIVPGGAAEVVVPLEPGLHVLLCAARLPDGTLAVMRGMYRSLEVVGPATPRATPAADGAVLITADDITVRAALRPGSPRLRIRNTTSGPRELRVYPVRSSDEERRLRSWLVGEQGAPPVNAVAAVTALPAGGWALLTVPLERGEYAIVARPPALRRPAFGPARLIIHRVRVP